MLQLLPLVVALAAPPDGDGVASGSPDDLPPIQRPTHVAPVNEEPEPPATPEAPIEPEAPASPSTPEAAVEPVPAPAPAVEPEAAEPPATAPEVARPAASSMEIRVMDRVDGSLISGAVVVIEGGELEAPVEVISDAEGRASAPLGPGLYTVQVVYGGVDERFAVELEGGPTPVDFALAPRGRRRKSKTSTVEELQRSTLMASAGGVLIAGGIFMGVGAALEAQRPTCPLGRSDCNFDSERNVATALGVAAGVSLVGGTVLAVLGVRRHRRATAALHASRQAAGVTVKLKF